MRRLALGSIVGLLLPWLLQPFTAHAADPVVRAGVECALAGKGYFPFTAGRDRCWEPINGRQMTPKTVIACAVQRSDGSLTVRFHFSESPNPECDNGTIATREQYTRALPLLGEKERTFFLGHVGTK